MKTRDAAGNESGTGSDTIILDTTAPPTPSVSINSDAQYTTSTSVTLSISSSGASKMKVSNNSSFTGACWENYSTSKSWTLTSGDGTKTVYVKTRDAAGNESGTGSDTIILDATPPNTTITSPSNGSLDYDGNVTFCYTGSDNITPTSDLQYSYRLGGTWSDYTSSTSRNYPGLCGGSYTFEVKAKDGAQLVDPSPASVTICVVITPTGLSASAGNHYVDLSWNASCGATGYDIHYWRYNPFNYWVIDVGNVTSKRISGLTNGVKYYFRVRARTGCGRGAWSSYVTATPQGGCW